ncbi:MAG: alpha/beta hydrolase-fold protein, partial [Anaerolineales bacterium]|nr:alpha/beta hydrolase-fold protein [Anaerolineales bacterium]
YETPLRSLWLQDGQIFSYRPPPKVAPSQVIKVPYFQGSLPARPLYIYLPRGYEQNREIDYPVIYMQDGQNVFETYVEDSYVGSWRADEAADRQIAAGRMQECLIVGVSHGGEKRLEEYLPPYATIRLHRRRLARAAAKSKNAKNWRSFLAIGQTTIYGRADRTFDYYQEQVAPFVAAKYRVRKGREHTALSGSSMGGLFSLYCALERPDFARNYAVMSPAFAATAEKDGRVPILEHLRQAELPEMRLWLDSGSQDSPGVGDDDFKETLQARDILLEKGLHEGPDFHYLLDREGTHNEASWSRRLPDVFAFLFPMELRS